MKRSNVFQNRPGAERKVVGFLVRGNESYKTFPWLAGFAKLQGISGKSRERCAYSSDFRVLAGCKEAAGEEMSVVGGWQRVYGFVQSGAGAAQRTSKLAHEVVHLLQQLVHKFGHFGLILGPTEEVFQERDACIAVVLLQHLGRI
jgi:ribosome modulation factor